MIRIEIFTQDGIVTHLDKLAQLRIAVFREYPYLYEGTIESEKEYLETFVNAKQGIAVVAFDDDSVVGMSTGLPLAQEPVEVQGLWATQAVDSIYYFSESVLYPAYRGQGIGVRFFTEREAWARKLGYAEAVFCAVVRPEDHPLKPENYVPLDQFWHKRGFVRKEGYFAQMAWQDVQETQETTKLLQYWWKALEEND